MLFCLFLQQWCFFFFLILHSRVNRPSIMQGHGKCSSATILRYAHQTILSSSPASEENSDKQPTIDLWTSEKSISICTVQQFRENSVLCNDFLLHDLPNREPPRWGVLWLVPDPNCFQNFFQGSLSLYVEGELGLISNLKVQLHRCWS